MILRATDRSWYEMDKSNRLQKIHINLRSFIKNVINVVVRIIYITEICEFKSSPNKGS